LRNNRVPDDWTIAAPPKVERHGIPKPEEVSEPPIGREFVAVSGTVSGDAQSKFGSSQADPLRDGRDDQLVATRMVRSSFAYRDLLKQPMSGQRGLSNSAEMRG